MKNIGTVTSSKAEMKKAQQLERKQAQPHGQRLWSKGFLVVEIPRRSLKNTITS